MRSAMITLPLVSLLLFSGPAVADERSASVLDSLQSRLAETAEVSAGFSQTRTLAEMERPIRSEGHFAILRGQGILWEISRPYEAVFLIGPDGILQVSPDGQVRPLPEREGRFMSEVGQVLVGLFSGQFGPLERHFDMQATGTAEAWEMALLPKGGASAAIRSIRVSGKMFPESVRLDEPSGDLVEIHFSGHQTEVSPRDRDLLRSLR